MRSGDVQSVQPPPNGAAQPGHGFGVALGLNHLLILALVPGQVPGQGRRRARVRPLRRSGRLLDCAALVTNAFMVQIYSCLLELLSG